MSATIPTALLDTIYEGSSHRYRCEMEDEDSAVIVAAAITDVRGWLDDDESGVTINSRANVSLLGANGGSVVTETIAGVPRAVFYWYLTSADAAIVSSADVSSEDHRLTLKFTYTRSGGGSGLLTHRARYPVVALERHP
ncbi:hypothetical protein [Luteitalea sp.]|uniref:hypothetical protein n=1 Tax=Luteitalea sp. TaxID=2004800 RepID=UPI0025C1BCEF|nr:hypothetical protein [Luteitalea sp.]